MKLISCYIENFGGLSQYELEFSDGLTVIKEPNGFGKTTLAEFLRAMFYGFPRKAKTLDKSKRQKYTPWDGGKFGGNLVFEYEGKQYRLERSFGTTPRGDSFNLIDLATGRKSSRFSENIGLELFQLDADSFERSTYMPQVYDHTTLTTTGIQAKLGDLVEDTGDINHFDKAVQTLRSRRSGFIPYRGSGGSVAEAAVQITRVQKELDRVEGQKEMLEQCAGGIRDTEAEIERKKLDMEAARRQWEQTSKAAASRQQLEDLTARRQSAERDLRILEEAYPLGIPGEAEIRTARQIADRLAVLEDSGLKGNERAQYETLCADMEAGLLDQRRLEALAEQNRQLLRQKAALESLAVPEEELREKKRLNSFFEAGWPDVEEIQTHRSALEMCEALRMENAELEARAAEVPEKKNPMLLILGAVAMGLGLLLMVMRIFTAGAIAVAVGIVLLGAGVIRNSKQHRGRADARTAFLTRAEENRKAIARAENRAAEFTRRYSRKEDLNTGLDEIQQNLDALLELNAKLRTRQEQRTAQEAMVRQTETALYRQLGTEDFDSAISELRLSREKVMQWTRQETRRQEELDIWNEKMDGFFARFGLAREPDLRQQLQRLYDDGILQKNARLRLEQLSEQLRQIPELPESADPEILEQTEKRLRGEYAVLTEKLMEQRQTQRQLQEQADRIPELSDELERWQQQKNDDQRKARILDDTMDFLEKARDSLTTSYLGPIRENFSRYLAQLTGNAQERAFISPELDVQLERRGQARELGYFSAGQSDLVLLCMRLALVDALFGAVKPFVILDDPFVNLDDEHTAEALKLLRELGRQRQIIYLTCNSSRSL